MQTIEEKLIHMQQFRKLQAEVLTSMIFIHKLILRIDLKDNRPLQETLAQMIQTIFDEYRTVFIEG